jgi:hypothetical protein
MPNDLGQTGCQNPNNSGHPSSSQHDPELSLKTPDDPGPLSDQKNNRLSE